MKSQTFRIPLYETNLKVYVVKKSFKKLYKKYKLGGDCKDHKDHKGFTLDKNGNVVIGILKSSSPGTIAHEALHATHIIMKYVYMEPDLDNDEAEAYLLTYIVDKIHKFKNKI